MSIKKQHPEIGRNFKLLLYPDCETHKTIIDNFKNSIVPVYADRPVSFLCVEHNKMFHVEQSDTENKPHYHIAIRVPVPISRTALAVRLGLVKPDSSADLAYITVCTGKFSHFLLYLTHYNVDKEKYERSALFGSSDLLSIYDKAVVQYDSAQTSTQDAFDFVLTWIRSQDCYISYTDFAQFLLGTPFFRVRNDQLLRACLYEHNKQFVTESQND